MIATAPATRARALVLEAVEDTLDGWLGPDADEIRVSDDAGSFHPAPLGVLVGLPALVGRGVAARTYSIPVTCVSADPLNTRGAVDALFGLADVLVIGVAVAAYTPTDWGGGVNRDPLPAVRLDVVISISESEG